MDASGVQRSVEAGALAAEVAFIPLPSPVLGGWAGLCAGEYGVALLRLRAALAQTAAALAGAAALLAAEL